jgi:putative ABC transport system ATP-binding protein
MTAAPGDSHANDTRHGEFASASRSAAPIVDLSGVDKVYSSGAGAVRAVSRLTLRVAAGEMVALCGPSGCGKSTCLNLLSGVDRADAGELRVCGVDLRTARERDLALLRRRKIGIVFQAFHLVPHLTVEENVALPLALDRVRDPVRVRDLIERVGLTHRRDHHPLELSGGEQQRAAVARALVHRPMLLLADEPTGNLDSQTGAAVLALLDELRRDEGAALVLATHDAEVARAADRVVSMKDGRIEGRA